MLSIIIPVLNEAANIGAALNALAPVRRRGAEVIVVDGGSEDDTVALALPLADQVITAPRGRAEQMNAGAAVAGGDVLVFLHADTRLPPDADRLIADGLAHTKKVWGRFDIRIASGYPVLAVVAAMMNLRSRLTGIATGDQVMFVRAETFRELGGFPILPLMEDIAFSARLKRLSRPLCLRARAVTSARHWERRGVLATIMLMWRLRLAYFFGAEPASLARRYGYAKPAE